MSSAVKPNIEEQLVLYRQRKRKEEEAKARKERLWLWMNWIMTLGSGSDSSTPSSASSYTADSEDLGPCGEELDEAEHQNDSKAKVRRRGILTKTSSSSRSSDWSESGTTNTPHLFTAYTAMDWAALVLKLVLWALLMKIFIIIEFGAVFFIFSAFVFIWYNLRSEPKKKGEVSAYSVFNPNCESIDGTFTAEQFERELLHKM